MEYLCHYTKRETAELIIKDMSLKFGKVKKSNDPIETKRPIVAPSCDIDIRKTAKILESQIDSYSDKIKTLESPLYLDLDNMVQHICFSIGNIKNVMMYEDGLPNYSEEINLEDDIIEYVFSLDKFSKRPPYYLPRMWAQYGDNNEGVCLIFNKEKLIEQIQNQINSLYYLKHRKVRYRDLLKDHINPNFKIFDDETKNTKKFIIEDLENRSEDIYFTKDIDWRDEQEYKFLLWNKFENDNENDVFIKIDNESLIGVVLGLRSKDYELNFQLVNLSKDKSIRNILRLRNEKTRIELSRLSDENIWGFLQQNIPYIPAF